MRSDWILFGEGEWGSFRAAGPLSYGLELFEGSHRLSSFMSFPNLAGFCSAVKDHVPLYLTLLFYFIFSQFYSLTKITCYQLPPDFICLATCGIESTITLLRARLYSPYLPIKTHFFTIYQPCITFIVICFYYQISVF